MNHQPDPPRLNRQQLLYLLTAEARRETRPDTPFLDCFTCHQPVQSQQARTWVGGEEERLLTVQPCGHRFTYNAKVADMMRARAVAAVATEATQAAGAARGLRDLVERLTRELHRRSLRLEALGDDPSVAEAVLMNVRGEVLGLQAALGMALGGEVAGGDADRLAYEHYRAWCARQGVAR